MLTWTRAVAEAGFVARLADAVAFKFARRARLAAHVAVADKLACQALVGTTARAAPIAHGRAGETQAKLSARGLIVTVGALKREKKRFTIHQLSLSLCVCVSLPT